MKTILVPTDFSEFAVYADRAAIQLAKQSGAEIIYLHSLHTATDWLKTEMLNPTGDEASFDWQESLLPELKIKVNKAKQKLSELVDHAEKEGLKASTQLGYSIAHEDILEFAEGKGVDLLLMGTHGASGFEETFIGSNAQKVIRRSKHPVLVVKDNPRLEKVQNIVYASDFDEQSMSSNLNKLQLFAKAFKARIHLLFVNTPNYFEESKFSIRKMEEAAAAYHLQDYSIHIYNHFTVEDGIMEYSKQVNADIISLSTHGFGGVRRFFNNNITEFLCNHSQLPVLSFNIKT